MSPIELARGSFSNNNHMKILLFLCALSVVVMHFNQDLSPMYWVGLTGFTFTGILIAKRLDDERAARNNKKHL